jgi:iron(II)-dependent oxidoreductase
MAGALLSSAPNVARLAEWVQDARQRTLLLIEDLSDEQLLGPRLDIINPLLWEIGHVAWFQENWVLRHACEKPPLRNDADELYNSAEVRHDTRWDLTLPSRRETLRYMSEVEKRVLDQLGTDSVSEELSYFVQLAVFHEDMHTEAFTYSRQTLGYPAPPGPDPGSTRRGLARGNLSGDVVLPGGVFRLGAEPESGFVFDNEKWAHSVEVQPFAIARAAVTQSEFAAFVDDGGYRRPELWSEEGWKWRFANDSKHPVYWSKQAIWTRRDFDRLVPLEPHRPVIHVNWYEADAYCRWASRRLPTEAEWELAAGGLQKHRFPWGDAAPSAEEANLEGFRTGCVDVAALGEGDSPVGCRQMIGNVWEWTASDFGPYPGFVPDPYKEYSQPWFGTHKVLRGGCWVTRARLLRNSWRNFYTPDRRDVWAGYRTCALSS